MIAKPGGHFVAIRGGADGSAGLLLAINKNSVAYISSIYDKKHGQSVLRLHLNNGRTVAVFEPDAPDVLAQLGLDEFVADWTLNLVRDIG